MAADEGLPWTTTRCNRLLRPLSSKLAKLRTQCDRPRPADRESRRVSTAFATTCSPRKTTNFTRPAHKPRGFEKAKDPDWRPGAKPGASKKTYGGRGLKRIAGISQNGAHTGHVSRPGEIAFTPLVARMGNQLDSSPQVQISPLKKHSKNWGPLQVNVNWTQMPTDLRKLVQGTLEAYANILQTTADGGEKSWKGTRSLMGACLRKVPAYIELEEYFAKLDREAEMEDEERGIADKIYEHLENQFEQRPGQGWRPFKHVVRAHATSLLCDAIMDQVIGLDSLSTLVAHCVKVLAWEEAERLLIAHIPLLDALSIPVNIKADLFDAQRSPYLCAVKTFVDHTRRHRLLFDLLDHMIAHELLPLEWLATECMRPLWDRLVHSISSDQQRTVAQALQFFETITIAGIGLPDERLLADEKTIARRFKPSSREEFRLALNITYSSLLTVMCSIALVNNSREDEIGGNIAQRITWMFDAVVVATLNRGDTKTKPHLLEADTEDRQAFLQRSTWTIFAAIVVHLDNCPRGKFTVSLGVPELIHALHWLTSQYPAQGIDTAASLGSLPILLSSIARGTGRIWRDDGFDQLQRLVQTLMSLSGCRMPHKLWTLKRLALESAIEFAQDTRISEHLAYAREIERKMRTQGQLVIIPSPNKNESPTTNGGFRWEEGIGEWVACTPFVRQVVKRPAHKQVPILELLPTPVPSEDEDILPENKTHDRSTWETIAFDQNEDDEIPHSSPIKKVPRNSVSSLGKRSRAPSPIVIVHAKRTRTTPPNSPIQFYPNLPGEGVTEEEPRRSRRSETEIKALTSRLQTQRSRTSLESGLRNQKRKTYAAHIDGDETSGETSSENQRGESLAIFANRKTYSQSMQRNPRQLSEKRLSGASQYNKIKDDTDERDHLGITPRRPRTKRRINSRNATLGNLQTWRKTDEGRMGDSSDDMSKDELSFH
ncbi:hypothetical protein GQ44DRAFT_715216 [Phaeosphaeriaceae sp. PMI808]|nr:hypothetical protein GQ44DRAFT_715216 [Phaeosphaeriaceae sp. PMI808]